MDGWIGWDGNLCVGLFYEHRFAVLITLRYGPCHMECLGTHPLHLCVHIGVEHVSDNLMIITHVKDRCSSMVLKVDGLDEMNGCVGV